MEEIILSWIQLRLIDQKWNRKVSGLYIYSRSSRTGKTSLAKILSELFAVYWWNQENDKDTDYELIVFDGLTNLNSKLSNLIYFLSDGEYVRFDGRLLKRRIPFIILSNISMTELGLDNDNIIQIEVNDSLFNVIDIIMNKYN